MTPTAAANLLVDQGVTNRLFKQTVFLVPGDGTSVQPHNLVCAIDCLELMLQRMPEERMEAIPSPPIVERNDKDTLCLKLLQQGCATTFVRRIAHHEITQRTIEFVENRGPQ